LVVFTKSFQKCFHSLDPFPSEISLYEVKLLNPNKTMAVDRNGNVLLSGVTVNSCCVVVQPAYYTAKYAAADGQILWEQLNFVGVDGAVSRDFVVPQIIVVDSAGNAIVNERNAVANVTPGGSVKNLVKYAGVDGNVIWEQLFEVGNCIGAAPSALAVDNADNVIVTGDAGKVVDNKTAARYSPGDFPA